MIVHYYKSRHWGQKTFKLYCSGQYLGKTGNNDYTTVFSKVTCRDCIIKLLPEITYKIEQLQKTLGRLEAGISPGQVQKNQDI